MEVNVAITIKVETLFGGGSECISGGGGGWEIARGGRNISSWGEDKFSPPVTL